MIAPALRPLRRARGLSQRALAARANVTFQHINAIENGRHNVSLPLLRRLAAVLEADVTITLTPRTPATLTDSKSDT